MAAARTGLRPIATMTRPAREDSRYQDRPHQKTVAVHSSQ